MIATLTSYFIIVLVAIFAFFQKCHGYESNRGASSTYKNASSAMLASIIYQKASIDTNTFVDDAVEPLLKTIFSTSEQFLDNFNQEEFIKALNFYKAIGKTSLKPMLVTDVLRENMVRDYINNYCGV